MPPLTLYYEYSRQDVHNIFSPDTRFTPSAGTWGLHGIVDIPDQPGDFVFFVTFGQQQADHTFEEWITEEGVFSWQSQPRQSFEDRRIQKFIHHDNRKNSIHLFLRTQSTANYTYLGKLRYLAHDPAREKPVYMYWQLVDWPIPDEVLNRTNLQLQSANIFRQAMSQIMNPVAKPGNGNTTFVWRGMTWQINPHALISLVRDWIVRGLPEEAIRYKEWYVNIDGQRISPKWLFHLITGAGYNEFDAPLAREKLSKVGLVSVQVREKAESDVADQKEGSPVNSHRLKPSEYLGFFKKISLELPKEFPDIFRLARYRFPDRVNWFEIHFPNLKGYYCLRLARKFDEFAFYFLNDSPNATLIVQQFTPQLPFLSETMGYPTSVDLHSTTTWGRLGFEIPNAVQLHRDNSEKEGSSYSKLLAIFIQATYNQLVELQVQHSKPRPNEKAGPNGENQTQIQVLFTKVVSIRQVLSGSSAIPSDEVLCDWVHFCYDFGFFKEGQMLFTFVTSEQVNPWYYERTKKIARLCSMKAIAKD